MAVSTQACLRVGGAATRGLPRPGESVPRISWPTVSLFFAALAVFALSSWAAIEHRLPGALTVAANALAIFVMFTVLHDAAHRSISKIGWVERNTRPGHDGVRLAGHGVSGVVVHPPRTPRLVENNLHATPTALRAGDGVAKAAW